MRIKFWEGITHGKLHESAHITYKLLFKGVGTFPYVSWQSHMPTFRFIFFQNRDTRCAIHTCLNGVWSFQFPLLIYNDLRELKRSNTTLTAENAILKTISGNWATQWQALSQLTKKSNYWDNVTQIFKEYVMPTPNKLG